MDDHLVSAHGVNIAGPGKEPIIRYRGRCSCGWTTYQHYTSVTSAKRAVEFVHNQPIKERAHA